MQRAMQRLAASTGIGPLRSFVAAPKAAFRASILGTRGRRRGGQLRSAKFLFTPLATPPSARAVVCRHRCSRAARRSGCLLKKRAGGAGKAAEGVAGGVNKNLAERSRPPPRRLCLNGLETQRRTADVPRDRTGAQAGSEGRGFIAVASQRCKRMPGSRETRAASRSAAATGAAPGDGLGLGALRRHTRRSPRSRRRSGWGSRPGCASRPRSASRAGAGRHGPATAGTSRRPCAAPTRRSGGRNT